MHSNFLLLHFCYYFLFLFNWIYNLHSVGNCASNTHGEHWWKLTNLEVLWPDSFDVFRTLVRGQDQCLACLYWLGKDRVVYTGDDRRGPHDEGARKWAVYMKNPQATRRPLVSLLWNSSVIWSKLPSSSFTYIGIGPWQFLGFHAVVLKTSKNCVLMYNHDSQKLKRNQVMTFITTNSLTKTTSSLRGLKITGTGSSLILILSLKIKQTKANYFLILK